MVGYIFIYAFYVSIVCYLMDPLRLERDSTMFFVHNFEDNKKNFAYNNPINLYGLKEISHEYSYPINIRKIRSIINRMID